MSISWPQLTIDSIHVTAHNIWPCGWIITDHIHSMAEGYVFTSIYLPTGEWVSGQRGGCLIRKDVVWPEGAVGLIREEVIRHVYTPTDQACIQPPPPRPGRHAPPSGQQDIHPPLPSPSHQAGTQPPTPGYANIWQTSGRYVSYRNEFFFSFFSFYHTDYRLFSGDWHWKQSGPKWNKVLETKWSISQREQTSESKR